MVSAWYDVENALEGFEVMEKIISVIQVVLPIFCCFFLGLQAKRRAMFSPDDIQSFQRFVVKFCLPCLLFVNVYNITSIADIDWSVVLYSEVVVLLWAAVGFFLAKRVIGEERQEGVIMQCMFRSNFAIIGLPLAESLGGAEGAGVAAVLSAFSIPTFNILAVIALTVFLPEENGKKTDVKSILGKIAPNPLIWGALLGLAALGIRSVLPVAGDGMPVFSLKEDLPVLFNAVNNIAKICGPLSLLILGGIFDFGAIRGMKKPIIIGTVSRIFIVPLLSLGVAILLSAHTGFFNFDKTVYPALLALFGAPVAVSSAAMAQEMDNDGTLAGQLVVWTSVFSIATLFLFIFVLRNMGLL